ncbi:uncharacterized protein LDX57_012517 [Aspergillus melleus]|uniref:uncharacterized protein n=1 Tax=Aspergillus melleus TaxID=138277 RepID=UPI001E8E17D3|nr:uncharacterized protein LDX57_012517 [Aspergillus melleus]KAH8434886.1 hypothetical protein LDX57_012517 [Aspergillus melleus]
MAGEFEKKQVSSLVALPNEILYQVANYLEYADDASALSRSCRFLYSLVNPTLIARYAKSHQKQAIQCALEKGDHILLQRLLEAGVKLGRDVRKEMFTNAAERGYTELLRFLQDANLGGDPRETREYNLPFVSAVLHERWETARFLVSRGADPNYIVPWGWEPSTLNAMARRGCLDGVRFLVEEGVSSLEVPWRGRTPLMNAARCGSLDVVKYLIAAGAKHRTKDEYGRTAIFHAAHKNHEDIMLFLIGLEKGADIFEADSDMEALVYAANSKKGIGAAKLLLDRVNIEAKLAYRYTRHHGPALLSASAMVGCEPTVQLLLNEGCDPLEHRCYAVNCLRQELHDPLGQATAKGHGNIVRRFLRFIQVHNPSMLERSRARVIISASRANQVQLLREILDGKITRKWNLGKTLDDALVWASYATSHKEAILLLIERGATMGKDKQRDFEILCRVAAQGSPEVVRLLLNKTGFMPMSQLHGHSLSSVDGRFTYVYENALFGLVSHPSSDAKIERIRPLLESNYGGSPPSDQSLRAALGMAVYNGHVDIVKYFLDRGFDANLLVPVFPGAEYKRLLAIAAGGKTPRANEMTSFLLTSGADVEARGGLDGATALKYAVRCPNYDTVKILLNHGANPLATCDHYDKLTGGPTPLHDALYWRWNEMLPILLKAVEEKGLQWDIKSSLNDLKAQNGHHLHQYGSDLFVWAVVKQLTQHQCRMTHPCP